MKRILVSTVVLSGLFISNGFSNSDINLTNGLVAHYEFEGNANDSSINNNDGISYGGINYIDGVIGKAVSLDGIDDWIKLQDNLELVNNNYTLSSFIKPNFFGVKSYTSSSCYSTIFSHRKRAYKDGSDLNSGLGFGIGEGANCDGNKYLTSSFIGNDNNYNVISSDINSYDNDWLSYTVVRDESSLKIFINGSLIEENNISTKYIKYNEDFPITSIGAEIVSDYSSSKLFFNYSGSIDDLRIYNRALNELEIEELYKLADLNNTICIQQIIYAQNPNTKTWIPFPTLCDVPNNWETNLTQPSDFNRTTLGLPPEVLIDEDTTNIFNAGFNIGMEYVLNNISEFNTSISSLNSEQVDKLEQGWHLLGTGYDINNSNIFNSVQSVWKYDKGWYAYSPNSDTQSLIDNTDNIKELTNIEKNKGFWINK